MVYEYQDEEGVLDGYYSHFSTPVCEDRQCLEAELVMYWDVLGNFLRFDTIPGRPLTKSDHEPFSEGDYEQLERILRTKKPSFVYLERNQLVREAVDGITSATVLEVKQDMIQGAIYSCYTLWHIANGDIVFPIQAYTQRRLDNRLVKKILSSDHTEQHYFLLDHIADETFGTFLAEILALADRYGGYFVTSIMERMPVELLESEEVQTRVWRLWHSMDHAGKITLLEKLQPLSIGSSVGLLLIRSLEQGSPDINERVVRTICRQAGKDDPFLLEELFTTLVDRGIPLSAALSQELITLGEGYTELKKSVSKFRRLHNGR